jgi:hypothetical protein
MRQWIGHATDGFSEFSASSRVSRLLSLTVSRHGKAKMSNSLMRPQEATAVVCRADRHLRGFRPDPRRALEVLQSVQDDAEFSGADPQANRIIRCTICAVTGDCHRMLGDVAAAADWYRRAAGHWKGGLGYPFFYADMVMEHQLTEHYRIALECLRLEQAYWRSKPLLYRFCHHLSSLWWLYPSCWKQRLRERSLVPRLEALTQRQADAG